MEAEDQWPSDRRETAALDLDRLLRELGEDVARELMGGALRCGPYRLIDLIGQGGFGEVYLATSDLIPRQLVAVKILKRGVDSRDVLRRFELEKSALATISHQNVAQILAAGMAADGRPWFAMPYLEGTAITLASDDLRLSLRERIDLAAQMCDGVQAAHLHGIIHRDLKPANVVLLVHPGARPRPVIIDFGIARLIAGADEHLRSQTGAHKQIGTPRYMSPEQMADNGWRVDVRSDVYALGVILAELLGGEIGDPDAEGRRSPIVPSRLVGHGANADGRASLRRLPDALHLRKALRGDLDAIVSRATMPDPQMRYQSAGAFADDLRRFLECQPVRARPPGSIYWMSRWLRRNRVTAALGGLTALAFVGLGVFGLASAIDAHRLGREARLESSRSAVTARFAADLVSGIDPEVAMGQDRRLLIEMLNRALRNHLTDVQDQDVVVSARTSVIAANAMTALEQPQRALDLVEPLVARLERSLQEDVPDAELSKRKFELASVQAAIGNARRVSDLLSDGGGASIHRLPAAACAWQDALDTLKQIGMVESPLGDQVLLGLWVIREPWPKDAVFTEFEKARILRFAEKPDTDPLKWSYLLRQAEIAPWGRLVREYPIVVDAFAQQFGEDDARVVRARLRQLGFVVGAAVESRADMDPELDIPRYSEAELSREWEKAVQLGEPAVARAIEIFGPRHNVTLLGRLHLLTARGMLLGAEAVRQDATALRSDAVSAHGESSPYVLHVNQVWSALAGNHGVAALKWWQGLPKGITGIN